MLPLRSRHALVDKKSFVTVITRSYQRRGLSSAPSRGPFDIFFLGGDEFSVVVLEQLLQHRDVWRSLEIATHPTVKGGRNGTNDIVAPLRVRGYAEGIKTHCIPHHKDLFRKWRLPSRYLYPPLESNNLVITASFGRMIHDAFLNLFEETKRLNVHPSLVPLYRGPAPIQHVIADGSRETGISILEMKHARLGADVGEIWAQKAVAVPPNIKFAQLRNQLAAEGGQLLASVLRDMIAGTAVAVPQDHTKASKAPFITSKTAAVDFHTWDAAKLERMYRAVAHQKPITTVLPSGQTLQLHEPRPYDGPCGMSGNDSSGEELPRPLRALRNPGDATYDPTTDSLALQCAGGTYAYIPKVRQQNRKLLAAKQWWVGANPDWIVDRIMRLGEPTK